MEGSAPRERCFPAHAKAILRQIVINFPSQCSIWMTNDAKNLPDCIAAVRVNPNLYSQTSRHRGVPKQKRGFFQPSFRKWPLPAMAMRLPYIGSQYLNRDAGLQ